jgi:hypothetical protein
MIMAWFVVMAAMTTVYTAQHPGHRQHPLTFEERWQPVYEMERKQNSGIWI